MVVVGDLFIDQVMTGFTSLPGLGEEAVATNLRREIGGGAAITGCGLAALGVPTKVVGVVGKQESEWFRQRLESKGVLPEALVVHPTEPTAITVAVSTANDRAFYTYPGANVLLPEVLRTARALMAQARHVHLACILEAAELGELAQWLHAQGCTVSVDVGWDESWLANPLTLSALAHVDWFFPNEREAARMSGLPLATASDAQHVLRWFANQGLPGVALKLGPEGSVALHRGEVVVAPPACSVQAIDTTGAGDCFDAGFLAAWLGGEPIQRCLARGNVCGAFSTRCAGGIEGFPQRMEVESELQRMQLPREAGWKENSKAKS